MAAKIKYHTKEEAMRMLLEDCFQLKYCTSELKNNEEVVLTAIKKSSWAFEYASDDLKSNKAFTMKALNEGVYPWGILTFSNINIIPSNLEVMTLAVEKSDDGLEFQFAQGEAAIDKELAAKSLVKWGKLKGKNNLNLWNSLHHSLKEFFPEKSWYKKAQTYLVQLEQEQQAELVSGGCKDEDGVVW